MYFQSGTRTCMPLRQDNCATSASSHSSIFSNNSFLLPIRPYADDLRGLISARSQFGGAIRLRMPADSRFDGELVTNDREPEYIRFWRKAIRTAVGPFAVIGSRSEQRAACARMP